MARLPHMVRLWPAYLMRHGLFLSRLVFSNENACIPAPVPVLVWQADKKRLTASATIKWLFAILHCAYERSGHTVGSVWCNASQPIFNHATLTENHWPDGTFAFCTKPPPVSRDIVSPGRLSEEMNKSIPPDGINRYRVYPLKLKVDIKHKMLMLNISVSCIVLGCSCGPPPYIFDIGQ